MHLARLVGRSTGGGLLSSTVCTRLVCCLSLALVTTPDLRIKLALATTRYSRTCQCHR